MSAGINKNRSSRSGESSIVKFFENRSIFVTGGTGFIGKVLIEKLLRSCPRIDKIYVLMRPKKGKSVEERLARIFSLPLYNKIRRENRSFSEKVVPIKGDTSEKNLGLSLEDRKILTDNVSVVFHSAASVRFDDPLRAAILLNLRGAYEMVKLAQEMKKLKSFVHVSTTYCNTHVKVIQEKIYPPPDDWRKLIMLAENLDNHSMEVFSRKILGLYPNTYTYTKALAEQVINDHQHVIPSSILRPSIVISSMLEPMPGWIDNFNGPVGLMVGLGKGVIRTVYTNLDVIADYMPVDVAAKAMITLAWERAHWKNLIVCNCSSHGHHFVTQGLLQELARDLSNEVPLNDIMWRPGGMSTMSSILFSITSILFHFIPALIVDTGLRYAKKSPLLLDIQRRAFVANMALAYFLLQQWTFLNTRLIEIDQKIPESEKPAFSYVIRDADPRDYFRNAIFGAREYLLKEDNTGLAEAKKHHRRMYWIDKVAKCAFIALVAYLSVKLHVIQSLSALIRSVHAILVAL